MQAVTPHFDASRQLLQRKERIENKPALFVGLVIFIGLPTLWTLLLWSLDTHAGVTSGIASMLWLIAGGLFAAVLGAQVICRDFGAPTERFLLSRPVAQAQVLRTKAWIGFVMLTKLTALVGLLDLFWHSQMKGLNYDVPVTVSAFVLGSGLSLSAYWIAVAAACVTHRSLTSVFAAVFVLILVVTVPLIIRIPGVNDILDIAFSEGNTLRPILFSISPVVIFGFVAAITIRWTAKTDRRVDVGPKAMAWVVSLSLTALFVMAMSEVGATERLVTTWWARNSIYKSTKLTAGHNRIVFADIYANYEGACYYLIDLDPDATIVRERTITHSMELGSTPYGPSCIDASGNYNLVGLTHWTLPPYRFKERKLSLRRFDWETFPRSTEIDLPYSFGQDWTIAQDVCCTDSRVYVLLVNSKTEKDKNNITGLRCAVAEYEVNSDSAVLLSTQFCIFATASFAVEPRWATLHGFTSGESLRISSIYSSGFRLELVNRPDVLDLLDARSDQFGIHILPKPNLASQSSKWPTDDSGEIGYARASPWGVLFRANRPELLPISDGRLLEWHSFSAVMYDVSDPTHPHRYAHFTTPQFLNVSVMEDSLVIEHGNGFSIAKLPPVTKK